MKTQRYGIPTLSLSVALILPTIILSASMASASINLAPPSLDDPYHLGKVTYHRKLACGTCLLSETTLDAAKACDFIERLNTDQQLMTLLNEKERSAVTFYLEKYFGPR
ncbi:hypothetical protein LCGC14_2384040 [marine sediment metagenome]|uniref:Uncharacterized protein n=1 Tax=marine sediment metagenome TaxID=412755 RepID=A0A0F9CM73_9ZZZZ|nr:hypothetical protein [Porticoccus sp.]